MGPAMIIEPTVIDGYGERPVEFSGAGVQEALVLSTLLPGAAGQLVVLDEPAVNLEPTVQRRLIGKLRAGGSVLSSRTALTSSAWSTRTTSVGSYAWRRVPRGSRVHRAAPDALKHKRLDAGGCGCLEPAPRTRACSSRQPSSCARVPPRWEPCRAGGEIPRASACVTPKPPTSPSSASAGMLASAGYLR